MYPDFYEGQIILSAWVYRLGHWQECELLEADAITQTAEIQPRGSLYKETVHFARIQNVALKHTISGRVVQNFGQPRINKPESIAYIKGVIDARAV